MKHFAIAATVIAWFSSALLLAQDVPMFPGPVKEHEVLKKFVGEWETQSEAVMAPGQPAMKCQGSINAKMLGGFWVLTEFEMESDMMDMKMLGQMTLGYDEKSKKYVGTWVDSMLNHMWKYEGTLDKAGKILTLEAEGPNFMQGGKLAKFRDVYEFKSQDEIATTSQMQGEDGKWITFMTGTAKRKKSAGR
jgi:hypothetical protein